MAIDTETKVLCDSCGHEASGAHCEKHLQEQLDAAYEDGKNYGYEQAKEEYDKSE